MNIWMNTSRADKPWRKAIKAFPSISSTSCIQPASFAECLICARALCQAENIEMNKTWSQTSRGWRSIQLWVFSVIWWAPAPGWVEVWVWVLWQQELEASVQKGVTRGWPWSCTLNTRTILLGKTAPVTVLITHFLLSFHPILSSVSSPPPHQTHLRDPVSLAFSFFSLPKPAFTPSVLRFSHKHLGWNNACLGVCGLHCYPQRVHLMWF